MLANTTPHTSDEHRIVTFPKKGTRSAPQGKITLQEVTFQDAEFSKVAHRGVKALNHEIPILILGETGAGKEVLARTLHNDSCRGSSPFVALNCAAIPEGLIESELFGYTDGAFTGARRGGMKGKVQLADKGTLFLDEIGDMPLDLQARLLRVLQDRRVTPLGSGKEIPVDITVICATHRDLKQMVAEGTFREDLYYRLNGMTIRIPSLRKRSNFDDFVHHMLRIEAGHDHNIRIDTGLMEALSSYRWPGNVRQLQTVLKTCVAFLEEGENLITQEHLTEDFREELSSNRHFQFTEGNCAGKGKTLKSAEAEHIRKVIASTGGNISASASALGISRATLYRRLQNAGMEAELTARD
ncbi:sigma-54-dependent Fis family transcriptional regulator [Pontibacterium sp.]|uniref:sigma-54-dependent Fis family transcriptional regulator n=1 Tax=Pontibacterium sp. TaxID=2036026 RepID=UPI0035122B0A